MLSFLPKKPLSELLALFTGAISVLYVSQISNPVFAAGVIGFIGAILFHSFSLYIYCGCFIGMSSSFLFANPLEIVVACIIAWFLMEKTKSLSIKGGKLGFIAFLSVITVALPKAELDILRSAEYELKIEMFLFLVVSAFLALVFTYFLRERLFTGFKYDNVLASALTGIVCGMLMSIFNSEFTFLIGEIAYASSFAAMDEKTFIRKNAMLIALLVAGIYVFFIPLFRGIGGKLGTIAFLSLLMLYFLKRKH